MRALICAVGFILLNLSNLSAQAQDFFRKGTHEAGISNIGIGYSSATGYMVSAGSRYQYYVMNRLALGAHGFYNNFNSREWMGFGPVSSFILTTHKHWFTRLDQLITQAKFNRFSDKPATLYGTTGVSINYLPSRSNFFIGGGYAHTYALNDGRVIRPNVVQVFAGWLWR